MRTEITLVLGGARSGKSEAAERIACRIGGPIAYVATGPVPVDDAEWAERVARHQARRPPGWTTVEVGSGGNLPETLRSLRGPALVDSLGTWVAGSAGFGSERAWGAFCEALAVRRQAGHPTVVVSEEVGLGVHPSTEVGREFRDALGTLNQLVSAVADVVLLVVAGRVLTLDPPGPVR